jgi:hypothetical protein
MHFFIGANKLTRKDGSLEGFFPNEDSYCVTSLVAIDLLCTIDLIGNQCNSLIKKNG